MNFLSIRGRDIKKSVIYTLKSKEHEDPEAVRKSIFESRFVGWESNANGKMGPNIIDLSDAMDPVK